MLTHEVADGLADEHLPPRQGGTTSFQRKSLIDRLILRGVFDALQPKLYVTGHHHTRRSVRPDVPRKPCLEMMGKDADIYGLAAIRDFTTGNAQNLVLEY